MTVTLSSLVQDIVDELGLPRPSSVIGNTDPNVRRILAMMNREGRDLAKERDWTALQRLHTFSTVDGTAEYALPSDFLRLIRDTEWDRTQTRPLIGPITPQAWESIKSSSLGSGVAFTRFKVAKAVSTLLRVVSLDPTPSSVATMAFWYISKNWCADSGKSTGQDVWTADDDEPLLDDDLIRLGTIVRFKRSAGFEYASEADEYKAIMDRQHSQDMPSPTLNLASDARLRLLGVWNLPETGYGA